jgi:hypothetical protein
MLRRFGLFALVLAPLALVLVAGCNSDTGPSRPDRGGKATEAKPEGAHGHKPGAHGGIIVEIGRDNYHAEAVFEKGGRLRLYALGKDEARVQEVERQELTAYAKADGDAESTPFTLLPAPQPGDADGKTSQFLGTLPKELWGKPVEVVIPSITIAGERFRVGFKSSADAHGGAMPPAAAGAAARKLYLTPGGKYTEADIQANGNQTAAQKYQGFRASHDRKPAPGDKVCPVTRTKANPNCTWVVGGKTYEFCCPPCIDEFVTLAKENPAEVREPEAYRKK